MKNLAPLCFTFLFTTNFVLAQALDVFVEMEKAWPSISFLKEYADFNPAEISSALKAMKEPSFTESEDLFFHAEQDFKISENQPNLFTWKNEENETTLQVLSGHQEKIDAKWKEVSKIGRYSGMDLGQGNYYMRYDSVENNIINLLFRNQTHIFSLHSPLPFAGFLENSERTAGEDAILKARLDLFADLVEILSTELVAEHYHLYKPGKEALKTEERIYGFTQFWTEVKYNFAFFDQVPDLDWDKVYLDYLPKVMMEQSNADYFSLLEEICALLEDGHTNIYPPRLGDFDFPQISLKHIQGRAIVQNMSIELKDEIRKGTEVIEVDGVAVDEYIKANVFPFISSSTDYIRKNESIRLMLKGITGSTVKLKLKAIDGTTKYKELIRNRDTGETQWAFDWPDRDRLVFKDLGDGIAHIELNRFRSSEIVNDFEAILDTFSDFDHFIIDLRYNGGGNSGNGYNILKYFADQPFATSKWSTRDHQASFKAWGSQYANRNDEELSEWQLKAKQVYLGEYWFKSNPDTIQHEKKIDFKGKLLVLIGNRTASAAEDFLIALDGLGIGKLVGEPTFGSTGQPLFIKLPRGGNARICTKKDTYPDGREFIGYGIKPDVLVETTLDDFLSDEDAVLKEALKLIEN